ncbi:FAD-dependent oxidoreductase, partial [Diaphorobacter nitroreducens]
ERLKTALPPSPDDQAKGLATNQAKLHALLPPLGAAMDAAFTQAATAPDGPVRTWAAVRCGALDRRPIVGPVDSVRQPGLWLCTAMGARGLTLSLLCGELIAARLHSEPLPLDAPLARALSSERWLGYEPQ